MNLKRARYIMEIYEAGGITAASKRLFVSQPSLSQTVRLVEQELGVAVFERGVFPPKLTYAGEQYLSYARAMMVQEENLNTILSGIRHEERGRLRLGVSIQRGIQLLPMVLPKFTRKYPDVELNLEEHGSDFLEKLVEEGSIDLGFATTEPSKKNLEYVLVENESFGLLAGKGGHLASQHPAGVPLELSDLEQESFVALKHGHSIRAIQNKIFKQAGISPKILLETDSVEAAMRITAACGCCMLCPRVFVQNNAMISEQALFYTVNSEHNTRHFYACYRKGTYFPSYMQYFLELVYEATRENAAADLL